jgi:hypothetical protein
VREQTAEVHFWFRELRLRALSSAGKIRLAEFSKAYFSGFSSDSDDTAANLAASARLP